MSVKKNRQWINERSIRTTTTSDKYGDKTEHTAKRVVMHFTPLSPLEKITQSGDPWSVSGGRIIGVVDATTVVRQIDEKAALKEMDDLDAMLADIDV